MKYFSTRGKIKGISFKDAVMMGMAEDGGLLLPEKAPYIDVETLRGKSFDETAFSIIKHFATDIPEKDLREIINRSYSTFTNKLVVPLADIKECKLAELFYGPTFAFKDVALQLLGNLFEYILKERNDQLNIIGATSGDTGSAAICGVRGKKNITITILYPKGKVSPIQEMQMTTVDDDNVHTLAVEGTFDDCQNIVKSAFADIEYKKAHKLGAINSINWARIMAQIVYYFYSYVQLNTKESVNFVVPTGNFGNIFAGYYAKLMGLPVDKLVLATNENDILHRFVSKGDYSLSKVRPTYSPSMDIQVASNFERYLYFLYKGDHEQLNRSMEELKSEKKINFTKDEIFSTQAIFKSFAVSNKETEEAIKRVYDKTKYIMDPHTACGVDAAYKLKLEPIKTIVLATALPAKFPDVVEKVLNISPKEPMEMQKLHTLKKRTEEIKNDVELVKRRIAEIIN